MATTMQQKTQLVLLIFKISLAGQPLHKRGRVWSTLHYGFVNVSHYFLGVRNHSDAHRRKCYPTHANRIAYTQYCAVWRAPNRPAKSKQKNVTVYYNQHRITDRTLY